MKKDLPEIHLHKEFMNLFDLNEIKYISWGAAGPDFLLPDYNCLGEVKRKEADVKSAIKELEYRKGKYSLENYNRFFIITPSNMRVYIREEDSFDFENPVIFSSGEKLAFIEFLINEFQKIEIENHMEFVLDFLLNEKELNIGDALEVILNVDSPYTTTNNFIFFNPGTDIEKVIKVENKNKVVEMRNKFLKKFTLKDTNKVKEYIKHNYSSHLPDNKKSSLGKYYTPKELVDELRKVVMPYITKDTYVLDLACGCGAFLEGFNDTKIIGRDIDSQAVEVLKIFEFGDIDVNNSLSNVSREKYNLTNEDDIVVIGNPPYNDTTSKNKRYGTNVKEKREDLIDNDIKSRDLGVSFLRAYSKLDVNYICILHPLSYLIKKANFSLLKEFKDKYKLKEGIVFSSSMFKDLSNKKTEFPVCIALYEKGAMDYDYISNFNFKLLEQPNKRFTISEVETIDGYIRKYPTRINGELKESDINLYMYNIRDLNSLITSGNIQEGVNRSGDHYATIMYEELHKYAYLNCMKHLFQPDYIYGNLSPIVNKEELESSQHLKDLFIIGMILKNQRLSLFNVKNKSSLIYSKYLYNTYTRCAKEFDGDSCNFYQIFIDFCKGNYSLKECSPIFEEINSYFNSLKRI